MTSHFIITSAIYTSYGKCSTEERIEQTRETIKSIETYAPESSAVIIDCGEKSVNKNLFDCEVIDYTTNKEIQYHLQEYLRSNRDLEPDIVIKSLLEIIMFGNYLKNITNSYERIFKISGRYKLNSNFNYNNHLEAKNKVLLLTAHQSPHFYNFQVSSSMFSYMTRCWSFDSCLLLKIIETYDKMKEEIIRISRIEKQGDIEHLFYKHLNKNIVTHANVIGIEGYWAPRKEWIEE
jgi:archaellum biogenesis ATPase FlaH